MKKRILFIISIFMLSAVVFSVSAQQSIDINSIRKAYSEAKQYVKQQEEEVPDMNYNVSWTTKRSVCGPGLVTRNYKMYFWPYSPDCDDTTVVTIPRFATSHYLGGSSKENCEFLFDETGKLIFSYSLNDGYYDNNVFKIYELRVYFLAPDSTKILIKSRTKNEKVFTTEYEGYEIPEKHQMLYDSMIEESKNVTSSYQSIVRQWGE